jgi:hypothetical protein
VHSLAGGGALLTKDYHCQIRHLSLKAIIATARALLLELDGYHMGVGAFPFLRVKRRDTGTGSMVQRGRGASHRPALHSNAHRAHVCVQ